MLRCSVDVQKQGLRGRTVTTAAGNQGGQCGQEDQTQDPAAGPRAGTERPGPRLDRGSQGPKAPESQGAPVPTAGLCFLPFEDMRLD